MNLLPIPRARLAELRGGLEEHLSGNFPHLWGVQIHVVAGYAAVGVAVNLILFGLFSMITDLETRRGLIVLAIFGQLGAAVLWFVRVGQIPRPNNIVEYRNSPLLTEVVVLSIAIMAGPLLLYLGYADQFPKEVVELVPMLVAELVFFATLWRIFTASKLQSAVPVRRTASFAGFFAATIVGGVVGWLGMSWLAVTGVVVAVVGFGACRFLLCIRAGWRSSIDDFWQALAIVSPPACVIVSILQLRSFNPLDFTNGLAAVIVRSDGTWLFYLGLSVLIVWIDLALWIRARFSMLPVREP